MDGTFVEANASKESRIPREQLAEAAQVHRTVREYLAELERQNPVGEPTHSQDKVSTTDPDSTYATKGGTPARMGYYNNYLVDNHSCIIVGVQATGARLSEESRAAEDMIARFAQWQGRKPQSIAADASYGNGEFLQWLMDRIPVMTDAVATELWPALPPEATAISAPATEYGGERATALRLYRNARSAVRANRDPSARPDRSVLASNERQLGNERAISGQHRSSSMHSDSEEVEALSY